MSVETVNIHAPDSSNFSHSKIWDSFDCFEEAILKGNIFHNEEARQIFKDNFEQEEYVLNRRKMLAFTKTSAEDYERRQHLQRLIRIASRETYIPSESGLVNAMQDVAGNVRRAREELGYIVAQNCKNLKSTKALCHDLKNQGSNSRGNDLIVFDAYCDFVKKEKRLPYNASELAMSLDDSTVRQNTVKLGLFIKGKVNPAGVEE